MHDVIRDVISCCVLSCDIGKINVYDKIVMKNKTKRENMEIEETYINLHLKQGSGMEFTDG